MTIITRRMWKKLFTYILPQLYAHASERHTNLPNFDILMTHAPIYTDTFGVERYGNTVSVVPPWSACSTLSPVTFDLSEPALPPITYPHSSQSARRPNRPTHSGDPASHTQCPGAILHTATP